MSPCLLRWNVPADGPKSGLVGDYLISVLGPFRVARTWHAAYERLESSTEVQKPRRRSRTNLSSGRLIRKVTRLDEGGTASDKPTRSPPEARTKPPESGWHCDADTGRRRRAPLYGAQAGPIQISRRSVGPFWVPKRTKKAREGAEIPDRYREMEQMEMLAWCFLD